jgi:hypothetical protein
MYAIKNGTASFRWVPAGCAAAADETLSSEAPTAATHLDTAKAVKIAALRASCRGAICAGVDHSALGTSHRYPLSETDQANMQARYTAAVRNSADANWRCELQALAAGDPAPTYKSHTASQTIAVAEAAIAHVSANVTKLSEKVAQVSAATTIAGVNAVVW